MQKNLIINPEMHQKGIMLETDVPTFAVALRTWRIRQNMSQEQVARRWGVSRHTILRCESGKDQHWTTRYRLFYCLCKELNAESLSQITEAVHVG